MSARTSPRDDANRGGMAIGTKVILVLGALTVIEYVIAVAKPPGLFTLILLTAVAKAVLIIIYFMHVGQLRKRGQS